MEKRTLHARSTDEFRYKGGTRLLAIGMWVRLAIVGGLCAVGGLSQTVFDETVRGLAWTLVIGGAVLAAFASSRVRALLGADHAPTTDAVGSSRLAGIQSASGRSGAPRVFHGRQRVLGIE